MNDDFSYSLPLLILRPGIIRNPNPFTGTCDIEWADRTIGEPPVTAILPQPFPTSGGAGMFAVPTDGSRAILGLSYANQYYVVSLISDPLYNSDVGGASSQQGAGILSADHSFPPMLSPGEVLLRGNAGSYTRYDLYGSIDSRFGANSSVTLDRRGSYTANVRNAYTATQSGYTISGAVLREPVASSDSLKLVDRTVDAGYDDSLFEVGRNPTLRTSVFTDTTLGTKRNPPLVETRALYFEYGTEFDVASQSKEIELYSTGQGLSQKTTLPYARSRAGTRTAAFDLSAGSYNALAETMIGTGVDFDGNLLDINRKPIEMTGMKDRLEDQLTALRRSIKLHLELNSRKENSQLSLDLNSAPFAGGSRTGTDHSRWSIDVDAEGQTKINIPASSPNGNIPLPIRHVPGSLDSPEYKPDAETEANSTKPLRHIGFGITSGGIPLADAIAPAVIAGTAIKNWSMPHHDLTFADILDGYGIFNFGGGVDENGQKQRNPVQQRYRTMVGGDILDNAKFINSGEGSNAGGRSLWLNADGSAEISLGKDQIHQKSLCLDAAGSALIRTGVDKSGNSIVLGADGKILVFSGTTNTAGGLKIYVQNGAGAQPGDNAGVTSIEISDGNIFFRTSPGKNIVFESGGKIAISASDVLINGERIFHFGNHSPDGSKFANTEKPMTRDGTQK